MAKFKLVFDDWQNKQGQSVYSENYELSLGNFHSGTTFGIDLKVDEEDEQELREAIKSGFVPCFYVVE